MRPMPFLHEMYLLIEIFGASHTVSKSTPMSKSLPLTVPIHLNSLRTSKSYSIIVYKRERVS